MSKKEGWSRIRLAVSQQEQTGTGGRTEGYISVSQDQVPRLEQIETGVRSQDHRPVLHPSA